MRAHFARVFPSRVSRDPARRATGRVAAARHVILWRVPRCFRSLAVVQPQTDETPSNIVSLPPAVSFPAKCALFYCLIFGVHSTSSLPFIILVGAENGAPPYSRQGIQKRGLRLVATLVLARLETRTHSIVECLVIGLREAGFGRVRNA